MSAPQLHLIESARTGARSCWNRIGVHGDSSCPELTQHVHCRNCPVYSAAAVSLLDVEPPTDYLAQWTRQAAQQIELADGAQFSIVIFRVSGEWLALRTPVLKEIVSVRTIHSIPHRRSTAALGLANIRGELLACFALQQVLGLEQVAAEAGPDRQRAVAARFLVLQLDAHRAVCPVDEVHGIARFQVGEVKPAPATVSRATVAYTRSVLSWQTRTVGLLDEQLLFHTLNRSLA
ncbi:MAG: chemotaxis protein CheW [Pseudomonadota bacterium]